MPMSASVARRSIIGARKMFETVADEEHAEKYPPYSPFSLPCSSRTHRL